jgi:hypothetical protein
MTRWQRCQHLSRGRGPIQTRCRRALHVFGAVSTSTAMAWSYRRRARGTRERDLRSRSVRRALESIGAVKIGRAESRGRPWLWRLRNADGEYPCEN